MPQQLCVERTIFSHATIDDVRIDSKILANETAERNTMSHRHHLNCSCSDVAKDTKQIKKKHTQSGSYMICSLLVRMSMHIADRHRIRIHSHKTPNNNHNDIIVPYFFGSHAQKVEYWHTDTQIGVRFTYIIIILSLNSWSTCKKYYLSSINRMFVSKQIKMK